MQKLYEEDTFVFVTELCVYSFTEQPVLTWKVYVDNGEVQEFVFVSAKEGKVVGRVNLVCYEQVMATGDDRNGIEREFPTEYRDGQYVLEDTKRNIRIANANGGKTKVIPGFLVNDDFYKYVKDEESENNSDIITYSVSRGLKKDYSVKWSPSEQKLRLYDGDTVISENVKLTQKLDNSGTTELAVVTNDDTTWDKENAVTVMANVQDTCNFYFDTFGRCGYDDDWGNTLVSYNDINNDPTNSIASVFAIGNKFNAESSLTIRLGVSSTLDHGLIGHEYTHGVIRFSAALSGREGGVIEEGICDIFGELVEDYAIDGVLNNDCDWIHGNRNIEIPFYSKKDKLPSQYKGENWSESSEKDVFDHHNCTVISHALYLMSEGIPERDDCDAIGNQNLAHLLYAALYAMPGDCSFSQFGSVLIRIARNMGEDGLLTAKQVRCVYEALVEADIVPIYRIDDQASVVFYDLDGNVIKDYELVVYPGSVEKMKNHEYETLVVENLEEYQFDLDADTFYQMVLKDSRDPEMAFSFIVETRKEGEPHAVIYTSIIGTETIINNGGRYVSYNGRTYYWKYNENSYTDTGLFGNFESTEAVNQLICRDASGAEKVIKEAAGEGKLFICAGRIYYQDKSAIWHSVLSDGSDEKMHSDRKYLAADEKTGVMIYFNSNGALCGEDGDGNVTILSNDSFAPGESVCFLKTEDGYVYYYKVDRVDLARVEIIVIRSNIQNGTVYGLGSFTVESDEGMGITAELEILDDCAYSGYTNIGGSGLFCSHGGVLKMKLNDNTASTKIVSENSSDSLRYDEIHVGVDPETGEKKMLFYNGAEYSSAGTTTHPWIDYDIREMNLDTEFVVQSKLPLIFENGYAFWNGDIVVYKDKQAVLSKIADQQTLASMGYTNFDGYETGDGHAIQYVEVVGDMAYISVEKIEVAPEASIGWRTAYRRVETVVYQTKIGSNQLVELYRY